MNVRARVGWIVTVAAMLATAGFVAQSIAADEKKEGDKPAAKEGAKKEKADPRGPLPTYYRDVVDGIQREKMYNVHQSYEAKIKEAQAAVKALLEKRDAELEALLRPDQLERVQQLKKEAKTKQLAKGDGKEQPKKDGAAKPDAK